jgi:hypothetical protein
METKDKGNITVDKGNKKQVKCHKFTCKPINRELMVHEDIENKEHVSVSDYITGYRLFKLPQKISTVKNSDIVEGLKKFIKHYTKEGIAEEFKRIENLQAQKEK